MSNIGPTGQHDNTPDEAGLRTALLLMGPTASGKTALACALHDALPCRLISVDSAQVYRGMDIGTAKPAAEALRRWPHRLIDIREPWEPYSAADFRSDALREMEQAHAEGRLPVLVGGTMLYFRALRQGLAPMPSADAALRRRLQTALENEGADALHRRLAQVDPQAAARIHPNDPQRLLRALEVYELTGQPISQWQQQAAAPPRGWRFRVAIVSPADRAWLHQRIEQRIEQMLAQGLVDEVARLKADPRMHLELPSMRAVGYRQVWQHLQGELDAREMQQRLLYATRQLAKRQWTWLRKESPEWVFDPLEAHWLADAIQRLDV